MRGIVILVSLLGILVLGCDKQKKENDCSYITSPYGDFNSKDMPKENFDIIVVAGQSNTNTGKYRKTEDQSSLDKIYQLGRHNSYDYQVIPAQEPLHHHCHPDLAASVGFARWFTEKYRNYKYGDGTPLLKAGRNILIIPSACGGSAFTNDSMACDALVKNKTWNPIQDDIQTTTPLTLYDDLVRRIRFSLEHFPGSRLVGIVFWQGGSDIFSRFSWTAESTGIPYNKHYDHRLSLLNFMQKVHAYFDNHLVHPVYGKIPFLYGGLTPAVMRKDRMYCYHLQLYKLYDQCRGWAEPEFPKSQCPFGDSVGFLDPGLIMASDCQIDENYNNNPDVSWTDDNTIKNCSIKESDRKNNPIEATNSEDDLHFSREAHKGPIATRLFDLWLNPADKTDENQWGNRNNALQYLSYECAWSMIQKSKDFSEVYNDLRSELKFKEISAWVNSNPYEVFLNYEQEYFNKYAKQP